MKFLAFLALGLLAACAQTPPSQPAAPPKAVEGTPKVARPIVEPPPPRPQTAPKPKPAPELTQPATPAKPDKAEPPKLVGMSEEETAAALGKPADETEQPPGKVWTYNADGCRLAVHLFPDMDRGGFYTLDYTAGEAPKDWCLGRVVQEARRKG